jgi:hypothetical protein
VLVPLDRQDETLELPLRNVDGCVKAIASEAHGPHLNAELGFLQTLKLEAVILFSVYFEA